MRNMEAEAMLNLWERRNYNAVHAVLADVHVGYLAQALLELAARRRGGCDALPAEVGTSDALITVRSAQSGIYDLVGSNPGVGHFDPMAVLFSCPPFSRSWVEI